MSGLAIECATEHVEVLVCGTDGSPSVHEIEEVGHGHTRRLAPLVKRALERASVAARDLSWVAADLGPGSFTGVRVGLATAEALALASGGALLGASSLAALAHGAGAKRALVVPLVPGGRRDLYAGFFRADARGQVSLLAAPRVGEPAALLEAVAEAGAAAGGAAPRFVGPGVARERARLEAAYPGSTTPAHRELGLSARDLAAAARAGLTSRAPGEARSADKPGSGGGSGPAAGLPARGAVLVPLYVRSAQAEERVRRRVNAASPPTLRALTVADLPAVVAIERRVFPDPWSDAFFRGELDQALVFARVAEREGQLAGYLVAWLGAGSGHIGNLAVVPEHRRRGVAAALLAELLAHARALGVGAVTLEVRVSNFAAQALYGAHGFRLAGLRRGYYRDTGEDALVMEWRDPDPARRGNRSAAMSEEA